MSVRSIFEDRRNIFLCAFVLFGGTLLLGECTGCAKNEAFGVPKLKPESQNIQIQRATRFDPYPDPNIGPEIHGTRPYGFDDPSTERIVPTKFPQH